MTPAIAELLKTETNADVQHEALLALGRIGSPDAILHLREWALPGGKLLGRKPISLRLAAIKGLSLAGPSAMDALASLERDESQEVRSAATAALGLLKP
jgi:HEAT repeat protein